MAFRLKIIDGDTEDYTPWYEEHNGLAAPVIAAKLRAVHPDGSISIERKVVDGALTLDTNALNKLMLEKRKAAGWSDEELTVGHKFILDDKGICQICRQEHTT